MQDDPANQLFESVPSHTYFVAFPDVPTPHALPLEPITQTTSMQSIICYYILFFIFYF